MNEHEKGASVLFVTADLLPRVALGLFCGGVLYALSQTVFKEPIEAHESSAYQRVARGLRNPRRIRDAPLRISFLTLCLVLVWPVVFVYNIERLPAGTAGAYTRDVIAYVGRLEQIALMTYVLIVLTTLILYMLACDPLPPCRGKVFDWMRGVAPARLAPSESAGVRGE